MSSSLKADVSYQRSRIHCIVAIVFIDSPTAPSTRILPLTAVSRSTATGSVTLQLNTFTDISGTITIGTPLTVTTTGAGKSTRYTCSYSAGQQISLTLTNSRYAGSMWH